MLQLDVSNYCWHLTVTFDVIYVKIKSVTGLNINNKILVSNLTIIVKFETKIYATDLRATKNNVLCNDFPSFSRRRNG